MKYFARVTRYYRSRFGSLDVLIEITKKRGQEPFCFFVYRFMPYGYSIQTQYLRHRISVFNNANDAQDGYSFDKADFLEEDTTSTTLFRFVHRQIGTWHRSAMNLNWAPIRLSRFLKQRVPR